MPNYILGISAYYHDSASALLRDGVIVAAAQEERFTRKKHDASFPVNAIKYVLDEAGIRLANIDTIAFYEKPYIKFERLLETYHAFAPRGLKSFLSAIPLWIREKLFQKKLIRDELKKLGNFSCPIVFPEHHLSHAASAFYPSPFSEAAILTIDGVGEWATLTIGKGNKNKITVLRQLDFPHSLGLLYSAFTYYTGFRVNSGEYKLMGLAPYGDPDSEQTREMVKIIKKHLIDIRKDGSLLLNMKYFKYATGLRMSNDKRWTVLFGFPPRKPETNITQEYMNMALAIQQITEEIIMKIGQTARELTGSKNLVMAGGVALNSVANGKLLKKNIFDGIWIQPAAGDAGGAVGAAMADYYIGKENERMICQPDAMSGAYLGPSFSDKEILKTIDRFEAQYIYIEDFEALAKITAKYISEGNVIGWFQGSMEFGPRALGNRSILGDARDPDMQKKMNLKIKYREGFRPFAPSVLEEDIQKYFLLDRPSPYMLLVIPVQEKIRIQIPDKYHQLSLYDKLYFKRSDLPAITHIDYSARIQSVNKSTNPRYWKLINEFRNITGCSAILNTSFNVRGEPIVCTPDDAYRCFMKTEMDYLVMGNYLFDKTKNKALKDDSNRKEEFILD